MKYLPVILGPPVRTEQENNNIKAKTHSLTKLRSRLLDLQALALGFQISLGTLSFFCSVCSDGGKQSVMEFFWTKFHD